MSTVPSVCSDMCNLISLKFTLSIFFNFQDLVKEAISKQTCETANGRYGDLFGSRLPGYEAL